mmetsp:Transcript_8020/g.19723  ORF Transcript_8020/g.19723 Transcript_8020/m.19723 type:complete len:437 (-) Transcript_8020:481-1791(-)
MVSIDAFFQKVVAVFALDHGSFCVPLVSKGDVFRLCLDEFRKVNVVGQRAEILGKNRNLLDEFFNLVQILFGFLGGEIRVGLLQGNRLVLQKATKFFHVLIPNLGIQGVSLVDAQRHLGFGSIKGTAFRGRIKGIARFGFFFVFLFVGRINNGFGKLEVTAINAHHFVQQAFVRQRRNHGCDHVQAPINKDHGHVGMFGIVFGLVLNVPIVPSTFGGFIFRIIVFLICPVFVHRVIQQFFQNIFSPGSQRLDSRNGAHHVLELAQSSCSRFDHSTGSSPHVARLFEALLVFQTQDVTFEWKYIELNRCDADIACRVVWIPDPVIHQNFGTHGRHLGDIDNPMVLLVCLDGVLVLLEGTRLDSRNNRHGLIQIPRSNQIGNDIDVFKQIVGASIQILVHVIGGSIADFCLGFLVVPEALPSGSRSLWAQTIIVVLQF